MNIKVYQLLIKNPAFLEQDFFIETSFTL